MATLGRRSGRSWAPPTGSRACSSAPAAYNKPAIALSLLREVVRRAGAVRPGVPGVLPPLGLQAPDARRTSFAPWRMRVGEDLSWFWRSLALHHGAAGPGGGLGDAGGLGWGGIAHLPAERRGMPMPVELALLMDDGSTQRLTPARGDLVRRGRPTPRSSPGPGRSDSVTVDPDAKYPDVRRENNRWAAGAAQSDTLRAPPRAATGR